MTRASDSYGTFAVVIGLMSWVFLLAHLVLFAPGVPATPRLHWTASLASV